MDARFDNRAPRISGVGVSGQSLDIDYSAHLMNVIVFFEPVSMNSLDVVDRVRSMSSRYANLSVGFWYVMEPRLTCMLRTDVAARTVERLGIAAAAFFDANNMIALYSGVRTAPTVFVADSNGLMVSRYEGEISSLEIERNLQARIALSGYRDELPMIEKPERPPVSLRYGSIMRQMGYASGDFVFSDMVVPESAQDFRLPDFYVLNTLYPFGPWFVGRDYIEGKPGSTLYVSCGKSQAVHAFAGADAGTQIRLHSSIESPHRPSLGRDVKNDGLNMQVDMEECRPYEILSNTGDADVLISLQIMSGSFRLFSVEFSPAEAFLRPEHVYRQSK